jgi:hypothetical protein
VTPTEERERRDAAARQAVRVAEDGSAAMTGRTIVQGIQPGRGRR